MASRHLTGRVMKARVLHPCKIAGVQHASGDVINLTTFLAAHPKTRIDRLFGRGILEPLDSSGNSIILPARPALRQRLYRAFHMTPREARTARDD